MEVGTVQKSSETAKRVANNQTVHNTGENDTSVTDDEKGIGEGGGTLAVMEITDHSNSNLPSKQEVNVSTCEVESVTVQFNSVNENNAETNLPSVDVKKPSEDSDNVIDKSKNLAEANKDHIEKDFMLKDSNIATKNQDRNENDIKDNKKSEFKILSETLRVPPLSVEITPSGISDHSPLVSPSANTFSSSRNVTTSQPSSPKSTISSPVEGSVTRKHSPRDGKVKCKRRGSAWNDDETEFLMEIWARYTENSKGEEFSHNAPVYRLIAKAMSEHGFDKSWEQCKTRIHTLKRAYKQTKDEVTAGGKAITYCRHFDNLEIIMGDHPTLTPIMLANVLQEKRKQKEANVAKLPLAAKRKQTATNKSAKKLNTGQMPQSPTVPAGPVSQIVSPLNSSSPSAGGQSGMAISDSNNLYHYPQPLQAQSSIQQQAPTQNSSSYELQVQPGTYQTQSYSAPPTYQASTPGVIGQDRRPVVPRNIEINNNEVIVKQERVESYHDFPVVHSQSNSSHWNTYTTIQNSQPQTGDDLERMRLDLEMKKIEIERNKIEMEERQRREDRDHQFRMMQLLLVGLGQQNSTHAFSGQGSEQEVTHTTNLSRALENGLVPGGSHTVNEKGLSFSEI